MKVDFTGKTPTGRALTVHGRDRGIALLHELLRVVHEAAKAAKSLEQDGISVELIDPRTVQPLDTDTIVTSVKKTNRALIVHKAVEFGGIGAEISSQISEAAFDYLDAPVARLAAPFAPVPYAPILENAYVPDAPRIEAAVRRLLERR